MISFAPPVKPKECNVYLKILTEMYKKKRCTLSQHQACGLGITAVDLNASHSLLQEEVVALSFSSSQTSL